MLKMLYGVGDITISKETLLHLCKIGFNNLGRERFAIVITQVFFPLDTLFGY
jgi:hypothetical protein